MASAAGALPPPDPPDGPGGDPPPSNISLPLQYCSKKTCKRQLTDPEDVKARGKFYQQCYRCRRSAQTTYDTYGLVRMHVARLRQKSAEVLTVNDRSVKVQLSRTYLVLSCLPLAVQQLDLLRQRRYLCR